ncbi:hypothetical protein L210DRAFT_2522885 [Boletus edulis BED1]|uniref:Uncharacterized protein n=1 Tax=Boletus edulis BED1 TaxID=1328754 RepID=A0AAD4GBV6_BOLED|nr:hypothetical protein L210DRAFT_2522885 [Boletus edulis BED1]
MRGRTSLPLDFSAACDFAVTISELLASNVVSCGRIHYSCPSTASYSVFSISFLCPFFLFSDAPLLHFPFIHMNQHTPFSSSGSPLSRNSPSSWSTCSLDTSSSTLSFLSTPSRTPSLSAFPSPTSGCGHLSYHHSFLTSTAPRADTSDVVHPGTGALSAVSPAGSYGSYRGTNTTSSSSLDEGGGSGAASGISSGMMGSGSSQGSDALSMASRAMGMMGSRRYGALEDESRADFTDQEGRRDRISGQEEGIDEHGHRQRRGTTHAHSTSLSTVTGSPPQPGGGSLSMGSMFPGSGHEAQLGHSVQSSYPHHGFVQQHAQPQAQALARMRASQGQYQYETVSASHTTPAPGFTNPHNRSEFQPQSQRMVEPQGQVPAAAPITRAPPVRTSTKRPRAPKRPRPDSSTIGSSRSHLVESDDDSDDEEIIEWVPGLDDGGGPSNDLSFGFSGSGGTSAPGAGGGSVQALPGLPGGRRWVSLYFAALFLHPCG